MISLHNDNLSRTARKSIVKLFTAASAAAPYTTWDSLEVVQRFVYGKLLDRLFHDGIDPRDDGHHPWIFKGSLARKLLRAPNDLDLCRPGTDREEARSAFERSLAVDLGDGFTFITHTDDRDTRPDSVWFPVVAHLEGVPILLLEVDLTHVNTLVNAPEVVTSPLTPIGDDGTFTPYLRYPVADHTIDKYCSILRKKKYSDGRARDSVRFGDFGDLADILTQGEDISIGAARAAAEVKGPKDGVDFSKDFALPDHALWKYQCEKNIILSGKSGKHPDFDHSLRLAKGFLEVMRSGQDGIWDPETLSAKPFPLPTEKSVDRESGFTPKNKLGIQRWWVGSGLSQVSKRNQAAKRKRPPE